MWTSSSSTSSSPSPSPFRHPKSMEEVWKDITLAASDLHLNPSPRGVILQDFFSKDPPPSSVPSPSPPPPPPTMLTLSSAAADHFGPLLFQPQPILHPTAFDAVVPDDIAAAGKKRFPDFDRTSGDRRHKRMIKNRESAARSRARKQESLSLSLSSPNTTYFQLLVKNLILHPFRYKKFNLARNHLQAYTNELELEVAHLLEENARLRKQQEKFYREAAAEHQKRKPLHRTSTAPF
ncbi:bZIP transcription factor 27-like isoform X1 [Salvia miltiorrhiza]|uniref:bZIP transcription factor 27-like isoform X1 n=1 Tax=Salvia miltiorrhiza TaxID=226208 RepID=UPI0025AB61EB|nr:bZIP transcription factor 27-like isoform X1 [Salvia miltiorrhiza]